MCTCRDVRIHRDVLMASTTRGRLPARLRRLVYTGALLPGDLVVWSGLAVCCRRLEDRSSEFMLKARSLAEEAAYHTAVERPSRPEPHPRAAALGAGADGPRRTPRARQGRGDGLRPRRRRLDCQSCAIRRRSDAGARADRSSDRDVEIRRQMVWRWSGAMKMASCGTACGGPFWWRRRSRSRYQTSCARRP